MRKILVFWGAFLCLSLPAAAQEIATAFDTGNPASEPAAEAAPAPDPIPVPANFTPSDRDQWQLGVGFQYQHFNVFNLSFHDLAYNASITRYLNDWFGLEGTAIMGWGHTNTTPQVPRALDAKSFFIGGGPHIALNNKTKIEPWGHVVVGLAHFRFTQTNNLGSNSSFGFLAGGGVDVKLGGRAYWRIQGDYVETHFQSMSENNYSFGSGLVFNF
jgi:hypothetical protein